MAEAVLDPPVGEAELPQCQGLCESCGQPFVNFAYQCPGCGIRCHRGCMTNHLGAKYAYGTFEGLFIHDRCRTAAISVLLQATQVATGATGTGTSPAGSSGLEADHPPEGRDGGGNYTTTTTTEGADRGGGPPRLQRCKGVQAEAFQYSATAIPRKVSRAMLVQRALQALVILWSSSPTSNYRRALAVQRGISSCGYECMKSGCCH